MIVHVCSKAGGVQVVEGMAGTGKSYTLEIAKEAWQAQGLTVRGAALAGKAAQGLQDGACIKSQTLHSLLSENRAWKNKLTNKDVVVIDEAGMVAVARWRKFSITYIKLVRKRYWSATVNNCNQSTRAARFRGFRRIWGRRH